MAPRTPTERRLVSIWEEVLGLESVGVEDHFFEIGGHSLLAVRLLGAIRDAFSVDLPFQELFAVPTVATSAARLEALIETREAPGPQIDAGIEEFEI